MRRAYTVLNCRAFDDEARTIEGVASTPTPDRLGDVIDPMGAKFALPMPLLWQHDIRAPVGLVELAAPTKSGIPFKATLPQIEEPGALRDRVEEAWQSVKHGLVRAVSIGFNPLTPPKIMKSGGYHFESWEWLELSLVTIPANSDAVLTAVKSLDRELLAALGATRSPTPGVSGTRKAARVRGAVHLIPRGYQ